MPFRDYRAEGGESWNDVYNRANTFINNLWKVHLEQKEVDDFIVDIQKAVEIGDDYSSLRSEETKIAKYINFLIYYRDSSFYESKTDEEVIKTKQDKGKNTILLNLH